MNRNQWLSVALVGIGMGLGLSSVVRAEAPSVDPEIQRTQFVELTYRSLCQRAVDPATLNYYLNVLEEGSRTPAEVHASIETTCQHLGQADACRHISEMPDICPPPTN